MIIRHEWETQSFTVLLHVKSAKWKETCFGSSETYVNVTESAKARAGELKNSPSTTSKSSSRNTLKFLNYGMTWMATQYTRRTIDCGTSCNSEAFHCSALYVSCKFTWIFIRIWNLLAPRLVFYKRECCEVGWQALRIYSLHSCTPKTTKTRRPR